MADGLADLGTPVEDQILVLNILQGLNQCFEHVGSIIRRYSPFPTVLYTNAASLMAKPLSSMPSCPPPV
jgi:hypothetical protein